MAHRRFLGLALLLCAFLGSAASAAAQSPPSNVQVQAIEAREDEAFSGVVATFTSGDPDPMRFAATIEWGDGTSSAGTVTCRSTCAAGVSNTYNVSGQHAWADPGDYAVRVTVTYSGSSTSGSGTARVTARDQPAPQPQPQPQPEPTPILPVGLPVPEGVPFTTERGVPFTGVVAKVPAGTPVKLITIDWGDGKKSPGTAGSDGSITGSHTFKKSGWHQITTTVTNDAGSSVGSATAKVTVGDKPGECEEKVAFAKLTAVGACILKIEPGVWEVRGTARVRINGLDFEPLGTAKVRLVQKSGKIVSTGAIVVRAGPIKIYQGKISLSVTTDLPGGFNVAAKAEVAGFPIEGSLAVRWSLDTVAREYSATLDVHLGLPKLFGGFTGDVALRLTNRDGLILDKLRLEAKSIYLGALHIQNLFVDYRRIGNEWRGGAKLSLPSGVGLNASPPPPEQGVLFRNGKLVSIGATLNFPNPGAVIASGVFLNSIGFQVGTGPTRFLGNAKFSTGSAGGRTLARIDAGMFIAFATPEEPFTAPVGIPPKNRTFTATAFHIGGTVTLVDRFNLGGAYLLYVHPGYAELAGEFNYNLLSGLVSAQARIGLAINTVRNQFNGEVGARVCAAKVACVGGDMIISNVGIGACARTWLVDVGGGFYWSGKGFFMWRSCDVGRVRVAVTPNQARAAQATGAGPRFTLPGGLDKAVIGVQGRDAAPVGTLVSPSGKRYTVPGGDEWVNGPELVAFRADENKETYFIVPRPEAGTWTVETAEGSSPVTGVQFAENLPEPQVRARVSGRGRARTVRYSVRAVDGQRVTLYEKGRETLSRIGEARGTTGRIRFTSADGAGGPRQIVAQIESFGSPRDRIVAGTYRAPGPVKPRRVTRLKASARGSRVCAMWRRGAGAREFAVTFRLSDGRKQLVVTRRRRACVGRVVGRVRGRVEVRGVSTRGTRGTAARATVKLRRVRRR